MKYMTLIIKPTQDCVASCVYCSAYKPKTDRKSAMSLATLAKLIHRLREYAEEGVLRGVLFTWHGGEPLLVGPDFYRHVLDLQTNQLSRIGVDVSNVMQSNLLLMTHEFAGILKKLVRYHDGKPGKIGTSFDPIPGYRILPGGSYEDKWMEGARILREHGLDYGIVYTVHKGSLQNIETVFDWFNDHSYSTTTRFNPIYAEGRAEHDKSRRYVITADEWGEFMIRFYELWSKSGKARRFSPFAEFDEYHYSGLYSLSCESTLTCPSSHLGIDVDGSVYSCGRGIDEGSFSYGNIHESEFTEILESKERARFANRAVYLRMTHCRGCPWWRYCHGGCPIDSRITTGTIFNRTNWCRSRKMFFEEVYAEPRPLDDRPTLSSCLT
jgi:uncharacterized protein